MESTLQENDDGKLWNIVNSLKGCPEINSPNETMRHNGRTISSNKKKANLFIQHYAKVSRHKFTKDERSLKRDLKKRLEAPSVDTEHGRDFTNGELKKAISKMRRKGAQGPDEIPPTFLKELSPNAQQELLTILNSCLRNAACPHIWRIATILPLLKANKPASELASFRPISLTSYVSKCFERMIAERLYYYAETNNIFDKQQAGFRKGRGCNDQIGRIIQAIQDGFNKKPMQRSTLVLLDFSKAYDTVWREKLLHTMIDDGVPMSIVRWLASFLRDRQAKIKFNGATSKSRKMKQGVPQVSVLSPILFLFYINQLAKILPRETLNALFADDVSVLATEKTKEETERKAQITVDVVTN